MAITQDIIVASTDWVEISIESYDIIEIAQITNGKVLVKVGNSPDSNGFILKPGRFYKAYDTIYVKAYRDYVNLVVVKSNLPIATTNSTGSPTVSSTGNPTESSTFNVDFFGDGSGIALYQLDGNINDTGGIFNGQSIGPQSDLIFTTDVAKSSFGQSLRIVGSQNQAFIIPKNVNLRIKSMSIWVKRLSSETSSNAYLLDSRNRGGNAYFIWNNSLQISGISKYLVNGQPISLDNSYKDQWIHLYIEFSTLQNGMVIGFFNGLSGNYDFGGLVDHIRLFNRPLSNAEVQQLYNEE